MTRGKTICGVLKTIRKQVADANDIKYEPHECHHQGECRGTCPACEAEVRYIERQLNIRRRLGKAVAVVGISAGLSALTGCSDKAKEIDNISEKESKLTVGKVMVKPTETIDGDVEYRSPVDTVIIDKDPATVKKRTAPFKAVAPEPEEVDSVACEEEEEEEFLICGEIRPETWTSDPESTKVFDVVEQMPSFPGGNGKLMEYLTENVRYPEECEDICVQGRVIVTCIIEKDGSVSNVKVVKNLDPRFDEEAVRVVSSMPQWNPGKQNSIAVRVKYTLPVTFRLQ